MALDNDFSGKVALVTGGSRGLGRAMALALAQRGADLVITSRKIDSCESVASEIEAIGRRALAYGCHVGKWAEIEGLVDAAYDRYGKIDILINNAGQSAAKPFLKITDEEWHADLDLKLMAAVRLTRLVWPAMAKQRWGRVINLLNVYAKLPGAGTAPTSISRAAGMALTKVLSAEGAAENILVNAMLIGFIESDQIKRQHEASGSDLSLEEFIVKAGARLPMQRMGRAEEAADLALFLASDRASYLTGCAINMDGGLSKAV